MPVLTARLVWLKARTLRCAWRSETAVQSKCALGDPERKQQIHSFCLNTTLAFTSIYSGISTAIYELHQSTYFHHASCSPARIVILYRNPHVGSAVAVAETTNKPRTHPTTLPSRNQDALNSVAIPFTSASLDVHFRVAPIQRQRQSSPITPQRTIRSPWPTRLQFLPLLILSIAH